MSAKTRPAVCEIWMSVQIRRYVYCNVVRSADIQRYIDISGIQNYIVNSTKVVFLESRPQSKTFKPNSTERCRTCRRYLREGCRYCSLYCKVSFCSGVLVNVASDFGTSLL
jgi:PLATZ transcription factor